MVALFTVRKYSEMSSVLIRGKYVICKITGSIDPLIMEDGAVYQTDGVIAYIGKYSKLSARHTDAEIISSSNHLIIPSLINARTILV